LELLAKQGRPLRPSKHGHFSVQMKLKITFLDSQISIFLLSYLTSSAKLMPDSEKLEVKLSSVLCA